MTRARIQLAYRDPDRTPLLFVLREMASRHEELEVHVDHVPEGDAYERGFLAGELDLVCEHLRVLFPARLRGAPVRCLAACQNHSTDVLVARPEIGGAAGLAGRTIALRATPSSRLSGSFWLRHLGLDGSARVLVLDDEEVGRWQQWRAVVRGDADAAICSPLYLQAAVEAGLSVLPVDPLPEIGSPFFAALGPFVARNEDTIRRFLRALYRALFVFRNDPATSLRIVSGEPARLMGLRTADAVRQQYELLRSSYDDRPIPSFAALGNTYRLVQQAYPEVKHLNPLSLWDLHYVLELEEAGFVQALAAESSGG